jgi:hypothetical protein
VTSKFECGLVLNHKIWLHTSSREQPLNDPWCLPRPVPVHFAQAARCCIFGPSAWRYSWLSCSPVDLAYCPIDDTHKREFKVLLGDSWPCGEKKQCDTGNRLRSCVLPVYCTYTAEASSHFLFGIMCCVIVPLNSITNSAGARMPRQHAYTTPNRATVTQRCHRLHHGDQKPSS